MSESAGESRRNEISNALIEEIVELRKMKAERNGLCKANHYYMEQVSTLELQVSQLKAQLMAKDYDIQLLTEKLIKFSDENLETKANSSKDLSTIKTQRSEKTTGDCEKSDSSRSECSKLKIQLRKEKEFNEIFENQLKELGNNILLSEDSRKSQDLSEHLKKLQNEVGSLREENQCLRSKLINHEGLDFTTAIKSPICSSLKISSMDLESSESVCPEDSTPRLESAIAPFPALNSFLSGFPQEENSFITPKKIMNPEPPQTRCRSECPKKAMIGKNVKYVKCNLTEVLNSSLRLRPVAEFCPTSMRINKTNLVN